MVPAEEEPGAVLVEQTGPLKEAHDLVPEEVLGGRRADYGTGTHSPEPVQQPRVTSA